MYKDRDDNLYNIDLNTIQKGLEELNDNLCLHTKVIANTNKLLRTNMK